MERDSMRDLRNRNLRNIAFITIVVILGLILLQSWFGRNNGSTEISYTQFREIVERGGISQVRVRDDIAHATIRPLIEAEFDIAVENRSGETLTLVSLSHDRYGDFDGYETIDLPAVLPAGGTYRQRIRYPVYGEYGYRDPGVMTAILVNNDGAEFTAHDAALDLAVATSPVTVRKLEEDQGMIEAGGEIEAHLPQDVALYHNLFAEYIDDVEYEPPSNGGFLMTLLITLLPILLLIGVWIFIMRRTQTGGGALSFGQSKAKLVTPDSTQVSFADVAGIDEVKEEVEEIVDYLKDQKRFVRLGAEVPKGVLLVGAPGTGKTLLAKAIAGEAKVPFFAISGSDFVEMFVGVGAARVRDMFEKAKGSAPCIIFIDEIDAVGRMRGAGLGGGHDEREQTLNQLLAEMDGFQPNKGIIILAATNRPDVLDPALLRPGRFDRRITVPFPTASERLAILQVHLKTRIVADDVDPEVVARQTPGYVGADLRNLCNEAALLAARRDKDAIEMVDFEEARDRLSLGLKRRNVVPTEKERKLKAYHESGHAITAHVLLSEDQKVHRISILPRSGGSGGVTEFLQPLQERWHPTQEELSNQLVFALGGRAAEEVALGEFAYGAQSDLRHATKLATEMVIEMGMNEELGPISLGRERTNVFLGEELVRSSEHSEDMKRAADKEIQSLLARSYARAKEILCKYRSELDNLASKVLEKEELVGPELDDLLTELIPLPATG
jgi:cell division protease FtsH